jgi:hypothetical protein
MMLTAEQVATLLKRVGSEVEVLIDGTTVPGRLTKVDLEPSGDEDNITARVEVGTAGLVHLVALGEQAQPVTRRDLALEFERLSYSSGVGLLLGVWAGRGDYASFSQEHRAREGHRALTELDDQIARLSAFRQRLNGVLTAEATP